MEKINQIIDDAVWFITAVLEVLAQFLTEAIQTITAILKGLFFVFVCLPLMMLYRFITRKDYEQ